jgi:hypothetical protein
MADGLGFSSISKPILERVAREERLGYEQPRKSREPQARRTRRGPDEESGEKADEVTTPMSSTHIDLRI